MMTILIRHDSTIPLEFPGITPDRLEKISVLNAAKLPVLFGNRTVELGEVATLSGDCSDGRLRFQGDTGRVKQLGAKMSQGTIWVEGNAGLHAGAQMTGGGLTIYGDAADWLGAEMRGGQIEVHGHAGHNVGSGYRGSRHGMRGGSIRVTGNAGDEVGLLMRRGTIVVEGTVGAYAGAAMIAGTIIGKKGFGPRAGSGMKRGTLIAFGQTEPVVAGFRYCCDYQPQYLELISDQIGAIRHVQCYRGDVLTGGRGELLLLNTAS
jgi:formylmethanofuran dehydrogenase subunit C